MKKSRAIALKLLIVVAMIAGSTMIGYSVADAAVPRYYRGKIFEYQKKYSSKYDSVGGRMDAGAAVTRNICTYRQYYDGGHLRTVRVGCSTTDAGYSTNLHHGKKYGYNRCQYWTDWQDNGQQVECYRRT